MSNTRSQPGGAARWQARVRWSMTVVWAALIYRLSADPNSGSLSAILLGEILRLLHLRVSPDTFETLHFLFRKSAHTVEYAIFAMFLYYAFLKSDRTEWQARAAAWSVIVAGLYSLTDEFHQLFVPGRGASIVDCGIDSAGASVGMLLIFVYTRWARPSRPRAEGSAAVISKQPVA